jgi:hypothetical protein
VTELGPPPWGGDPSIAWRILLTAELASPITVEGLADRQHALHVAQGWPTPPSVATGDPDSLRHDLAEVRDAPLVLGLADRTLVISAFHAYVDGLGLLDVLASLTGTPVTSSARGVGDRPTGAGGTLERLREVALAPPARIARPTATSADGDAFAVVTLPARVGTSELVHAAAAAVVAHNADHGRRSRHVTVAVGAGRPALAGEPLANRSELIRLRDLEGLSRDQVRTALRSAPLDPAGGSGAAPGRVTTAAIRLLAPRLGSTLLVSHLGDVATQAAGGLAFYPVTAGGTGLSLGAVSLAGRTVLTLRGRAATWDDDTLAGLLDRVASELPSVPA